MGKLYYDHGDCSRVMGGRLEEQRSEHWNTIVPKVNTNKVSMQGSEKGGYP